MQLFPRTCMIAAATLIAAVLSGCVNLNPGTPPPPEPTTREPYLIGVTDMLQIRVWNNQGIDVRVPVRNDGMISVPLIDDVPAEGLTPEELKEVITERLSAFISAPDVTVIVGQTNSKMASILGGVNRSRVFPLNADMRVLEAIASAGGFSNWAKKNQVRILRKAPEGLVEYRFDYKAYLKGKAPDSNILLRPGDTIVVPD